MSDTAPIEGVELEDFIRGRAHLEHAPDDVEAVVRALSLPDAETWRRAELGWRARVEENAQLARIVKLFVADYMRELRPERPDGAEERGENDTVAAERQPVRPEVPSYLQGRASADPPLVLSSLARPAEAAVAAPPAPEPPAAVAAPAPPSGSLSPLSANPPAARARGAMPVLETEPVDLEKLRGLLLANPTPFVGKALPERQGVGGEENRPQTLPSRRSSGHETLMLSQPASERVDQSDSALCQECDKGTLPGALGRPLRGVRRRGAGEGRVERAARAIRHHLVAGDGRAASGAGATLCRQPRDAREVRGAEGALPVLHEARAVAGAGARGCSLLRAAHRCGEPLRLREQG